MSFKPALPVIAAGKRTEAAISVPRAKSAEASQSEHAGPARRGRRVSDGAVASHGLCGLPECAFTRRCRRRSNSTMCVLPITVANCRRKIGVTTGPPISNFGGKRRGELPHEVRKARDGEEIKGNN